VLKVPIIFLEGVWGIHFESQLPCKQFSISRDSLILYHTWSHPLMGALVYSFQQSLNSILHPWFMVSVKQVMLYELIFQAVSNCFGFLGRMKFKA
jgi:hypothetical protein